MNGPISMGGASENTLNIIQPINLVVFFTFYSPIIVAICILSMSFVFQNFKGFIYLGFVLAASILREFALWASGASGANINNIPICNAIKYSQYGNSGISIFILSFTLMYMCYPMFVNNDMNYWAFGALLSYIFIDIGIRYTKNCITSKSDILMNLLTGSALGSIIPALLYYGGSSKYLFFNEISSNNTMCSMPKKQTFKCAVYKNGELIGSTTK